MTEAEQIMVIKRLMSSSEEIEDFRKAISPLGDIKPFIGTIGTLNVVDTSTEYIIGQLNNQEQD